MRTWTLPFAVMMMLLFAVSYQEWQKARAELRKIEQKQSQVLQEQRDLLKTCREILDKNFPEALKSNQVECVLRNASVGIQVNVESLLEIEAKSFLVSLGRFINQRSLEIWVKNPSTR